MSKGRSNLVWVFAGLTWLGASMVPRIAIAQSAKTASSFSELAAKASALRDADRLDEASSLYRKALALKPNWPEGWWSLGTLDYDRSAYKDAAMAFNKLVGLQPKSGTARVMLGLCEFELGEDDAALASLSEGRQLGVSSESELQSVVLYHEALLLQRKGRFESAEDLLDQLCRKPPYSPEVALALGAVSLRVRNRQLPAEGTSDYTVMLQTGNATCLGAQRKYEDGSRTFDALLTRYPTYPNLHYAYGKLLLDANDTDGAVKQFQAEIQNHPNDPNAWLRIASAKYRIDSSGGLPYAEHAVSLEPNLPLAHYLLGLLLLDTDNYAQAIPELEIAQKAFADQPKVYFALASAYARAGRQGDATRARNRAQQLKQAEESKSHPANSSASEVSNSPSPPRR